MHTNNFDRLIFVLILFATHLGCSAQEAEKPAKPIENQQASELPLVYSTDFEESIEAVSYTHLTLPTIYSV